jgi:hypothetical protein
MAVYDGVICDNRVAIRRVAFYGFNDAKIFDGMPLHVLKYDDDKVNFMTTTQHESYINNVQNYGKVIYTQKLDPGSSWAMPVVTGHKYRIHWSETPLDFNRMKLELSERWEQNDKDVYFVQNFTDTRVAINVTYEGG